MAYFGKETPSILSHKTSNTLPGCLKNARYRTCRTASTQEAATYTPVTTSTTDSSPYAGWQWENTSKFFHSSSCMYALSVARYTPNDNVAK